MDVIKNHAVYGKPISGRYWKKSKADTTTFVFGLYNDTDIRYDGGTLLADHMLAVGTTDANGELTFAGNYPHGRYTIRELYTPDG